MKLDTCSLVHLKRVGGFPIRLWKALRPGDYVISDGKNRFGMIVAVKGTEAAVLWSKLPDDNDTSVINKQTGRVNLRYNPMAYDEDIWIPIRCKNDGQWCPISGCKCGNHVS